MEKAHKEWFDALYKRNHKRLFIMAKSVLHNSACAEEIVHDVFLICICKINDVIAHENPDGWLTRTMKNQLGNELRKAYRARETSIEEYHNLGGVYKEEPFEELLPQGLSSQEQQLLVWYFQDRLSHEEISDRLHISTNACRTRLFRAKAHCKELLEK